MIFRNHAWVRTCYLSMTSMGLSWALEQVDSSCSIIQSTPLRGRIARQVTSADSCWDSALTNFLHRFLASQLGLGFVSCPNKLLDGSVGKPFKQYSAHWRDYTAQLLGPLIVTRYFPLENRTFAAYGPIDDECPLRFYFSRFPFLIAANTTNRIRSTGE